MVVNMSKFYFINSNLDKKILSYKDENGLFNGPYLVQQGNTLTLVFYKHGQLIGPYLNYVYGDRINYSITISTKVTELSEEFLNYGPTLVISNSGVNCGNKSDSIFDPDDLWVSFEWSPEIKVSYSQADEDSIYHNTNLENVLFPFQKQLNALNTLVYSSEVDDDYFEYKDFFIPLKMKSQTSGRVYYSQKRDNGLFVSYGSLDYERSAWFTGFETHNRFSAFMTSNGKPGFIFNNPLSGIVVKNNEIILKCKLIADADEEQRKILEALNVNPDGLVELIKLSSDSLYCYSEKKAYLNFNYFTNVHKHKIK